MKRFLKNPYFQLGNTIFWVVCCCLVVATVLDHLGWVVAGIHTVLTVLTPFIWGFVIAYLLLPMTRSFEYQFINPLISKLAKKQQPSGGAPRVLAITLALITAALIIFFLLRLLLPSVYDSVQSITTNWSVYINNLVIIINNLFEDNPQLAKEVTAITQNLSNELTAWVNNELLPMIGGMLSDVTGVIVNLGSGMYRLLQYVLDILIGVVISCYVLYNRERFAASVKRLLYVVFGVRRAEQLVNVVHFANEAFMGFLVGKIIDSTIIGFLTYFACVALNMPYPAFIAIIIGVTNIIPIFGPFIGAVPCTIIILMVNPFKALGFVLLIFVIQQIDGNIIGPKILGSSVGVNGFWIMFSIIVMGDLMGVAGMIIGVPLFAVISAGYEAFVAWGLKRRGLATEAALYVDMSHMDAETGVPVSKTPEQMTVGKTPHESKKKSAQSGE